MRYHLPPPDEPVPGTINGVARVSAAPRAAPRSPQERDDPGEDRLIRTLTLTRAEAEAHLREWEAGAAARRIPAPPGVTARERSRADRVVPGAMRRQRLAIAIAGDSASAAHWSVTEPPSSADELAWQRVLSRLGAAGEGRSPVTPPARPPRPDALRS